MDPKKDQSIEQAEITTGIISWDSKPQISSDIDWGAPAVDLGVKTDDFDLKWSDNEDDKDSDSDDGISMKIGSKQEEPKEEEASIHEEEMQQQIDIMAQQLKFVACLKILMEELSTLATGFEVDGKNQQSFVIRMIIVLSLGGQLRYQLYLWLEKEVEALRVLCNYTTADNVECSDLELPPDTENSTEVSNMKPTLHEILVQEKLDFEAKVQRAAKRKRWLRGM